MTIVIALLGVVLLAAAVPVRPLADRLRTARDRQSRRGTA